MVVNFSEWIEGLPTFEEDHVFTPIGAQSDRMTELLNERAALLEQKAAEDSGVPEGERSLTGGAAGERSLAESFTDRRAELDREIEEQLEKDHPDALRIRIRGISDEDADEINEEVSKIEVEGKPLSSDKARTEAILRMVSRAAVTPQMSPQDVRILRKRLNRGEWSRLLDHITRLTHAEAEAVDVPNY